MEEQPQPQPQPQWAPPPQQTGGWGTPGMGAPERPMGVTLSAIFFLVMAVLAGIAGLLLIAGGAMISTLFAGVDAGMIAALGAIAGVIVLVWAALHLAAGIGSLQGKTWGRAAGLVVAIVSVVLGVLGLVSVFGQPGMDASALVSQVVFLVLYGLAGWALFQAKPYFAYRR